MPFFSYSPSNWYWIVAGSNSQVFSSASMSYVANTDATYQAWVEAGGVATNILNAAELAEVLLLQMVPPMLAAGVTVNSSGTPTLNATYSLDPYAQSQITSTVTAINLNVLGAGGSTFVYPGTGVTYTGAQFVAVASQLFTYVFDVAQAVQTIVISGSGSMPSTVLTIA